MSRSARRNEWKARGWTTGDSTPDPARGRRLQRPPADREAWRPEGVTAVNTFKNPALKQLTDQQVRFAPPARRLEQLARAEKLLAEIDLDRQYPYQFVCFRITEFRPDSYPDLLIDGRDLEHDLCQMIEWL